MKQVLDILPELGAAQVAIDEHSTLMPDCSYEDGVIDALMWVIEHPEQKTLMLEILQAEFKRENKLEKLSEQIGQTIDSAGIQIQKEQHHAEAKTIARN